MKPQRRVLINTSCSDKPSSLHLISKFSAVASVIFPSVGVTTDVHVLNEKWSSIWSHISWDCFPTPPLSLPWLGAQERTKCWVLERQPESMVCTGQRETSGRRSPDLAVPTDTVSGRGPETASRATLMTFWNPAIHHHPEFLVTNNFLSSSINLSYQKLLYMGTHCMHGL